MDDLEHTVYQPPLPDQDPHPKPSPELPTANPDHNTSQQQDGSRPKTASLIGSETQSRLHTSQMSNVSRINTKSAKGIGTGGNALINTADEQPSYKLKFGKSIPELEKDRNQMEMTLTSSILLFN